MDEIRRASNNYHRGKNAPRRGSYQQSHASRGRNNYYAPGTYRNDKRKYNYYHNKHVKRVPSRPASPVEGSEEYMTRKIQHTSAIIMRHLLSPHETLTPNTKFNNGGKHSGQTALSEIPVTKENTNQLDDKLGDKSHTKNKRSNVVNLSAKEIHAKIMNHITNLNEGRKRNFINANTSTGLDNAINHMQKQKRLEISRILRDMNSSAFREGGDNANSIVPDIGIKIEELPSDVIEELRQTLNIDLEFLNEAIADSTNLENHSEITNISSGELNAAIDSIQVKREQIDSEYNDSQNINSADTVEIKPEDISDIFEESNSPNVDQEITSDNAFQQSKEDDSSCMHHSLCIKSSSASLDFGSGSTVVFQNTVNLNQESENKNESGSSHGNHENEKSSTSDNQSEFIERDSSITQDIDQLIKLRSVETILQHVRVMLHKPTEAEIAIEKMNVIDVCFGHLTHIKTQLAESIVESYRESTLENNRKGTSNNSKEKSFVTTASQTFGLEEDNRSVKRRKVDVRDQQNDPQRKLEIKLEVFTDSLETENILKFPKLQERIMAIERLDNELLLATESGNIIFASLKDGTFQHCLRITDCAITSMSFVRGKHDFIYMYVGCLEEVLRVYDFRKREILKTSHIEGQIRCMDSMWDYVFMGCKNGTLIRYSCKKNKIEFEEKNIGTDILVLKAAQEGPRRVLLVGHRQAPIYVRDAMSGLHLRNFSNLAVTPTVYSIVINRNHLYCGTAKDNILVFSFQEGHLIEKIVADDSKGISCLKIYKNLLFAGCYNGSIYVYNLEVKKIVTVLKGPGGSILCIEVLDKQVIVGTLTSEFESIALPSDIFNQ